MGSIRTTSLYLVATAVALMGCSGAEQAPAEELGTAKQEVITNCPFPQPSTPILFDNEMVIRTRGIVDDPCRTTWSNASCPAFNAAGGTANRTGKWTFGWLLTVMAGQTDPTSTAARTFVANWLNQWKVSQTIGSDVVAARTKIQQNLINPWVIASGCASGAPIVGAGACLLDLKKAPFRLLAIVNRIDLSGSNYGTVAPGEFRFVFGALNTTAGALNNGVLQSTVILEYKFPTTQDDFTWANQLHGLSGLPYPASPPAGTGTTPLGDGLQAISDLITLPNAQPGNPNNGSAIGQIRTNEIDYDGNASRQWELRQFQLVCGSGTPCPLLQQAVDQTPPTSANNTTAISNFIIDNQYPLMDTSHVLPASLLGGSSLSPSGTGTVVWAAPNPIFAPFEGVSTSDARHNFAFVTCNGCHYAETANNTRFHVAPRQATAIAPLSQFVGLSDALQSTDTALPDYLMYVDDPDATTGRVFEYNEPWRRSCEIRRLLYGFPFPFTTPTGHSHF